MHRYLKPFVRAFVSSVGLILIAILINRLFGYSTRGSWWLWLVEVPAVLAAIIALPALFSRGPR